jgi:hypothetical protein
VQSGRTRLEEDTLLKGIERAAKGVIEELEDIEDRRAHGRMRPTAVSVRLAENHARLILEYVDEIDHVLKTGPFARAYLRGIVRP